MEFGKNIVFEAVETLKSGQFYWVRRVNRCYRINEVDHFLKNMTTDLLAFLDKEERLHHFNRTSSRYSAVTSLQDLLSVPNLLSVDFFEFSSDTVEKVHKNQIHDDDEEEESEAFTLLKKTFSAFLGSSEREIGVEYSIKDLKKNWSKEYLEPVDLQTR